MDYKDKNFKDIDSYCPASSEIKLGSIIDKVYDDIKNGIQYQGELLSESQLEKLDKMCSASDTTDIAYILNDILDASKNKKTLDELDEQTIYKMNNNICGVYHNCCIGDKLNEMIQLINQAPHVDSKIYYHHKYKFTLKNHPTYKLGEADRNNFIHIGEADEPPEIDSVAAVVVNLHDGIVDTYVYLSDDTIIILNAIYSYDFSSLEKDYWYSVIYTGDEVTDVIKVEGNVETEFVFSDVFGCIDGERIQLVEESPGVYYLETSFLNGLIEKIEPVEE